MEQHLSALSNGLRVITCPMPQAESVAIGFWVGVGGRHEPDRLTGISHFIEHLLFKGTRRRSAFAISRAIEGRGGDFNAFTQEDATCYYVRMAARHADSAFGILAEMIRQPRLAAVDVASEREVIRDEILMYRDQPAQVAEDLLGELLWADHPLGRALAGSPESVARIRRADIAAYKTAAYVPSASVLAVAGRADHAGWMRRAERAFSDWRGRFSLACPPVTPRVAQRRIGLASRDTEQAHLALGFRVFGRHDARRHALKVLSVILGENMSSRLFQVVRERHGLAYAIQSAVSHFADTGSLVVTAGVEPDRIARVLELVCRELRRLREAPVGARELRRAQDYLTGQVRMGLENTDRRMNWAGESVLAYGRTVAPEEALASVEAVSAADVQAVSQAVFRPVSASLAVVSTGQAGDRKAEWDALLETRLGGD